MDSDHDSHTKEADDNAAGPGGGDESSGDDSNDTGNVEYHSDADSSGGCSDSSSSRSGSKYAVLSEDDVRGIQEEETVWVSSVLSVSRAESTLLLVHYNWDSEKVQEEWFTDQDRVRKAVGLLPSSTETRSAGETIPCGACSGERACRVTSATFCGHLFCDKCWVDHIAKSCTGQECLTMRCLQPCCGAAVGQDLVERFGSNGDNERYRHFLVMSYVEGNSKRKWCPAPGCKFAVEFKSRVEGGASRGVRCNCGHRFCWNCIEEVHWPLGCEAFANWMAINAAESESTYWILTNCKPCPNCKRPIEKDQGFTKMTCAPPCGFGFCWLCLGAWSDDFLLHSCNGYAEEMDETVWRRKMAKMYMDRYVHYFERWAANRSSKEKASECLQIMKRESPSRIGGWTLGAVIEAWEEVVEWRRILTWAYAYGYFLPEHERPKIRFFECLQGQAERSLEELQQCAEREFSSLLGASVDRLNDFRTKLSGLTVATGKFFKSLVQALERGLQEIDCAYDDDGEQQAAGGGFLHDIEYWPCNVCTFANFGDTEVCEVCKHCRWG